MKPTLIALLALGLCLPLAGAEKKKTDVEEDDFKGRVKSVKVSTFTIEEKFGNLSLGKPMESNRFILPTLPL
jgi:hypothetical protein